MRARWNVRVARLQAGTADHVPGVATVDEHVRTELGADHLPLGVAVVPDADAATAGGGVDQRLIHAVFVVQADRPSRHFHRRGGVAQLVLNRRRQGGRELVDCAAGVAHQRRHVGSGGFLAEHQQGQGFGERKVQSGQQGAVGQAVAIGRGVVGDVQPRLSQQLQVAKHGPLDDAARFGDFRGVKPAGVFAAARAALPAGESWRRSCGGGDSNLRRTGDGDAAIAIPTTRVRGPAASPYLRRSPPEAALPSPYPPASDAAAAKAALGLPAAPRVAARGRGWSPRVA